MKKSWTIIIMNILLIVQLIACNPTENVSVNTKPELKDEIHYPNGTVVGKYSYKDDEGNPISIKYYADRNSYGVELNSLKKFNPIQMSTTKDKLKLLKPLDDYMRPIEPLLDLASEIMSFHSKHNKLLTSSTEAKLKENTIKAIPSSSSPEKLSKIDVPVYETFYQNEVKAPKQCEKEKVRVYLVKEKRKVRHALQDPAHQYRRNAGYNNNNLKDNMHTNKNIF